MDPPLAPHRALGELDVIQGDHVRAASEARDAVLVVLHQLPVSVLGGPDIQSQERGGASDSERAVEGDGGEGEVQVVEGLGVPVEVS